MADTHQSDVSAWARCPAQFGYRRAGLPSKTNSAAAFGSVMHHAILQVLEREMALGTPFDRALRMSLDTFAHYWAPNNIAEICEPVPKDGWLPGHSYSGLRGQGLETIRRYADLIRFDESSLLGTEYSFNVPIVGTWDENLGEPHRLVGSIDRLAFAHFRRAEVVRVDDLKTGKDYVGLRWNLQFTAYCYATTRREFWVGDRGEDGFGAERGEELYQRFHGKGRRGTWISLKGLKFQDAGWRGPTDYHRFALAVEQMQAAITADIFPLAISGSVCQFCDYRSICGGTGLAEKDHGDPRITDLSEVGT